VQRGTLHTSRSSASPAVAHLTPTTSAATADEPSGGAGHAG